MLLLFTTAFTIQPAACFPRDCWPYAVMPGKDLVSRDTDSGEARSFDFQMVPYISSTAEGPNTVNLSLSLNSGSVNK